MAGVGRIEGGGGLSEDDSLERGMGTPAFAYLACGTIMAGLHMRAAVIARLFSSAADHGRVITRFNGYLSRYTTLCPSILLTVAPRTLEDGISQGAHTGSHRQCLLRFAEHRGSRVPGVPGRRGV